MTEEQMDKNLLLAEALTEIIDKPIDAEFSTALLCKLAESTARKIGKQPTIDILDIVIDTIVEKF